jgi:hypothetical protein
VAYRTSGKRPVNGTLEGQTERLAELHRAAAERDAIADRRDLAASAREQAAAARSVALAQIDAVSDEAAGPGAPTRSDDMIRAAGERRRAAQRRVQAAEHRALAAQDRQAQAYDREQAARERRHAREDREALASQLAITQTDELAAKRARVASVTDPDYESERRGAISGPGVIASVEVADLASAGCPEVRGSNDERLERVVAQITARMRRDDLVIRLNREQFLCTMSNMNLSVARERFGEIAAELGATPNTGAIRIGFAQLVADETLAELIGRPDATRIDSLPETHSHRKERTKDPVR